MSIYNICEFNLLTIIPFRRRTHYCASLDIEDEEQETIPQGIYLDLVLSALTLCNLSFVLGSASLPLRRLYQYYLKYSRKR
jgi:hypothetical protein